MRYYVPDIDVPPDTPEDRFIEKFGGMPFGLRADAWPRCAVCSKSQSPLAQFSHHPERLDLGRDGRVLFVFQCNHDPGMCSTWEAFSGGNRCVIVEPEEVLSTPTLPPDDAPPLDTCVHVAGWIARDDPLTVSDAAAYAIPAAFWARHKTDLKTVTWSTRFGSVPRWLQDPEQHLMTNWRFLGQIDSNHSFLRPPTSMPYWVEPDAEHFEGRTHTCVGPNFCDGIAYIFFRLGEVGQPEAVMMWQRV
jgi:hypothetical protein